jgi:hypothetical protein
VSEIVEQPPVEVPQEPVAPPEPTPDPEAVEAAALEQAAVELPEGDGVLKYVPLSAVTKPREEAKTLRGENKTLKEQLEQAKQAITASQPYVEAAKVLLQQQQQPPAPQAPQVMTPEQRAELEEEARDMDFYKTDGSLDLDRAQRSLDRTMKRAERIADQKVAPLQQQSAVAQAQAVLNQAKGWKDPATGETADPAILTTLWNKVAAQPNGLQTLTNPEAAAFIVSHALNLTRWQKGQQPAPPARQPAPQGDPVFVEPSGGGGQQLALNAMEKRFAREAGMSEADYLKAAKGAPRG